MLKGRKALLHVLPPLFRKQKNAFERLVFAHRLMPLQ